MIDRFGRKINYLRISVTDRCNLRCFYCMPEDGINLLPHDEILSFERIVQVAQTAVDMGVTTVRLTGGEPLVRHGIIRLVEMLASIKGIRDLAMTTNATLLAEYAGALVDAGLHRVNISLDTVDRRRYHKITRGGDINRVFAGIEAAQKAALTPIKLNCVADRLCSNGDVQSVKDFGRKHGLQVRIIRLMDFEKGHFSVVQGGSGGDCQKCNRLRLSSDGMIRPCLFSDVSFSVRRLGPKKALQCAVDKKPKAGGPCKHKWMHGIGG